MSGTSLIRTPLGQKTYSCGVLISGVENCKCPVEVKHTCTEFFWYTDVSSFFDTCMWTQDDHELLTWYYTIITGTNTLYIYSLQKH